MAGEEPIYDDIPEFRLHLVHDVGTGFAFGAACGSIFHFVRGLCSSPNGGRLIGGLRAVLPSEPRLAGSFGSFCLLFCASEEAMSLARRKEDRWNSIAAGAATMGIRQMWQSPRQAAVRALFGATLMSLLNGAEITLGRMIDDDPGVAAPAGHGPTPRRFLGIPPAAPIVVEEVPVADTDNRAWPQRLFSSKE